MYRRLVWYRITFLPEDGSSSFIRSEKLKALVSLAAVVLVALPGGTKSDMLRNVPLDVTCMGIMGRRSSLCRHSALSSCAKEMNEFCQFYPTTCSRGFPCKLIVAQLPRQFFTSYGTRMVSSACFVPSSGPIKPSGLYTVCTASLTFSNVELTGIINKPLLLHLVGCLYYLYQ